MEGFKELKGLSFSSLSPKWVENGKKVTRTEKTKLVTKPSPQVSVKGKKALAQSRVMTSVIDSSVGSPDVQVANKSLPLLFTAAPNRAATFGSSDQGANFKVQSINFEEPKHDGEGLVIVLIGIHAPPFWRWGWSNQRRRKHGRCLYHGPLQG